MAGETFANSIINGINNNRLFRSYDNTVVEGFGHQHGRNSTFDIGCFINNHWGITRAYADSRFTGTVCRFNYARPPVAVIRLMSGWCISVRKLNGRLVDPADQILGTGSNRSLQNDVSGFVGRIFCTWVRGEDDCVTGLQADQRFEDSGRRWVGG